jgi:hypothetical protein
MSRREGSLNALNNHYKNLQLESQKLQDRLKYMQTCDSTSKACERLVQFTLGIYDPLVQLPKANKSAHKVAKEKKKNRFIDSKRKSGSYQEGIVSCGIGPDKIGEYLFDVIPDDIWYHIFRLLDAKTVSNISVVCKRWKDIYKHPEFLLHWEEVHLVFLAHSRQSTSSKNVWKSSSSRHMLLALVG